MDGMSSTAWPEPREKILGEIIDHLPISHSHPPLARAGSYSCQSDTVPLDVMAHSRVNCVCEYLRPSAAMDAVFTAYSPSWAFHLWMGSPACLERAGDTRAWFGMTTRVTAVLAVPG